MVRLRLLEESDADALFPLIEDSRVTATLIWDGPSSLDDFRVSLGQFAEDAADGKLHAFAIVEEASGLPVGCLTLRPVRGGPRAIIGLWIGLPYQGKGYGTAAIGRVVDHAFGTLGLHRVEAAIFTGNPASRRAFEKNGFVLEGTIRQGVWKRGEFRDEWVMGILREEWRGRG